MNIARDPVTARVLAQHSATRMARLRALETEGREVLIRANAAIRECKIHASRVAAMIEEFRASDETTVRLPALPEV